MVKKTPLVMTSEARTAHTAATVSGLDEEYLKTSIELSQAALRVGGREAVGPTHV